MPLSSWIFLFATTSKSYASFIVYRVYFAISFNQYLLLHMSRGIVLVGRRRNTWKSNTTSCRVVSYQTPTRVRSTLPLKIEKGFLFLGGEGSNNRRIKNGAEGNVKLLLTKTPPVPSLPRLVTYVLLGVTGNLDRPAARRSLMTSSMIFGSGLGSF